MTRVRSLCLIVALALGACSAATPPAASVDGLRISDEQLSHDVPLFRFLSSLNNSACGQPVPGESEQAACARFTLSNLIQEDLVKEYARAHDVSVPADQVQSTVAQLEGSIGADQLDARLAEEGLDRADLEALARRLLLFGAVQRALAAERVSDEQLRSLYEQQRTSFTQLRAKHILVATKALADTIERQVTTKNFADLARKYSTDPGSAAKGGDLGPLAASALDPAFVAGALALQPGQISPPVHTQFGWHIILLKSVTVTPFEQVKPQLLDQEGSQVFGTWLRARLAAAAISVNPKYGRLDLQTGEIVPIRSTGTGSPTVSSSPSPAVSVPPSPATSP